MGPRSNKVADGSALGRHSTARSQGSSIGWVDVVCPQRNLLHLLSREHRFYMFQLVNGSAWTVVVTLVTLISLFANDVNTVLLGPYSENAELTVLLVVCFIAFTLDCLLKSTFDFKYVFSFYFWLDLVSTVSLGIEFVINSDGASSLLLARTARATRAGARLTRLLRLLKLIRMIRILKLWKMLVQRLGRSQEQYVDYQKNNLDDTDEDADSLQATTPQVIAERLTSQISRKVVIGILVMLASYSIVESGNTDLGPHVGIQLMHGLVDNNVSTATVQELFLTFAHAYPNKMVNASALVAGLLSFAGQSSFDRLCSSKISNTPSSEEPSGVALHQYVSNFHDTCQYAGDIFVDMDFTSDQVDDAYTGIFQTLILVIFILGWAWLLQHDVQHLLVEPLMGLKDGVKNRKSRAAKPNTPGGRLLASPSPHDNEVNQDTNNLMDSTLELMVRNTQDRSEPRRTETTIRSIIQDVGSSNMHKLVSCLTNLRTSLVQERTLQDAVDGVIEVITRETPFQNSLYAPVMDRVVATDRFRESNTEVRRWVVAKLFGLPKTTYVELSNAAIKKLGVDFVDQKNTPKEQSKPAGAFNFKSQMEVTTPFGIIFDEYATELNTLSRKLEMFDFDVASLTEPTGDRPLLWLSFTVLTKHNLPQTFKLKEKKLIRLLEIVEFGAWLDNPYHNNYHSANIVRAEHWFLTSALVEDRVSKLDILALVLSGIFMNYQHTGRTNEFEVDTESQLSVFFDHDFVLERYALAAAFTLLNHDSTSICESMAIGERELLRSLIIEIVLARSLRTHIGLVEKAKLTPLPPAAETLSNAADAKLAPQSARLMLLQLISSVANISHVFKPKKIHLMWTERFFTQQFEMGEDEASLKLPISPLCDRDNTQIGHAQVAFFDFVARPALDALGDVLAGDNYTRLFNNFDSNYMLWAKVMNKEQSGGKKTPKKKKLSISKLKAMVPRRISLKKGDQVENESALQDLEVLDRDMQNVSNFRSSTQYSRKRKRDGRGSISADACAVADEIKNMLNNVSPYDITTPAGRGVLRRAESAAKLINQQAATKRS